MQPIAQAEKWCSHADSAFQNRTRCVRERTLKPGKSLKT